MADALQLQLNVRQNAEELQDILQDLNKWEDEVKAKDNDLRSSRIINKKVRRIFSFIVKLCLFYFCLLYTSPSPRDQRGSRMPSSA